MSVVMARTILAILLAASVATAHGGAFRPPPGGGGDPGGAGSPWKSWWALHAERFLDLRARLLKREVITGPERRTDLFDRKRLREKVLAPIMLEALRDADEEVRTSAAVEKAIT